MKREHLSFTFIHNSLKKECSNKTSIPPNSIHKWILKISVQTYTGQLSHKTESMWRSSRISYARVLLSEFATPCKCVPEWAHQFSCDTSSIWTNYIISSARSSLLLKFTMQNIRGSNKFSETFSEVIKRKLIVLNLIREKNDVMSSNTSIIELVWQRLLQQTCNNTWYWKSNQ